MRHDRLSSRGKVWIAGVVPDMRCGMTSLALKVQQGLGRDPHGGEVFCFRGRKGDLIERDPSPAILTLLRTSTEIEVPLAVSNFTIRLQTECFRAVITPRLLMFS